MAIIMDGVEIVPDNTLYNETISSGHKTFKSEYEMINLEKMKPGNLYYVYLYCERIYSSQDIHYVNLGIAYKQGSTGFSMYPEVSKYIDTSSSFIIATWFSTIFTPYERINIGKDNFHLGLYSGDSTTYNLSFASSLTLIIKQL